MARAFELHRDVDETGVSGEGIVAEGVEFSDGTVALRWTSQWPTSVVFHDRGMDAVQAVHGHGGKTRIVWVAEAGDTALPKLRKLEGRNVSAVGDTASCGHPNPIWYTDSRVWNEAVGGDPDREATGVLCPACFAAKVDEMLDGTEWECIGYRLLPDVLRRLDEGEGKP